MPEPSETLPQCTQEIRTVTITEIVQLLPEVLPWSLNVWYGDKLARFGRTAEGVIFLAEMEGEPSVEQREFFEKLLAPLGIAATLYEGWKNRRHEIVRLYNEGRLIVDKTTRPLTFRELPTPVYEAPILTSEEFKRKLPLEIPFPYRLYLTGGLVKVGWTCNDVDFLAPNCWDVGDLAKMARYFSEKLGWKTDVGNRPMPEREPIFTFPKSHPLYQGGKLTI